MNGLISMVNVDKYTIHVDPKGKKTIGEDCNFDLRKSVTIHGENAHHKTKISDQWKRCVFCKRGPYQL